MQGSFMKDISIIVWLLTTGFFIPVFLLITLLMYMYTDWYILSLLYILWMIYDKGTPETGGRSSRWVRDWNIWQHFLDYFPLKLVKTHDLVPKRNCIICIFPHGKLIVGAYAYVFHLTGINKLFPGITPRVIAAPWFVKWVPFARDINILLGLISNTESSIAPLLSDTKGGTAVVIPVGGAEEAKLAKPGSYTFYIQRRSGFARLALKHGVPLVPSIAFGETDLFDVNAFKDGSLMWKIQKKLFEVTGTDFSIFWGRWFYIPYRKPVYTVVGSPMVVEMVLQPTAEQIQDVKDRFIKHLTELFEKEKHKYVKDPENTHLKFV